MKLTKEQRNRLFGAIAESGINPTLTCELKSVRFGGMIITHRPTGSTFHFNHDLAGWSGSRRVGTDPAKTWAQTNWESLVKGLEHWAELVTY